MINNLFTTEFVTEGHPDKLADQISDQVLDSILTIDPNGRVACEVLGSGNLIVVGGEITADLISFAKSFTDYTNPDNTQEQFGLTHFTINNWAILQQMAQDGLSTIEDVTSDFWNTFALEIIVKQAIEKVYAKIGYGFPNVGYDISKVSVLINIQPQSPDIALGTNDSVGGAGDQGFMFGYATNETTNLMPLGYEIVRELATRLELVRKSGVIEGLLPDGKTQISYDLDTKKVFNVVVSTQHTDIWTDKMDELRSEIKQHVIESVLNQYDMDYENAEFYINQTGHFLIGGFEGDAGLTGRKIIVDTYGGYARHGGGCFSGKDATKVDRSGAYMARYLAKNILTEFSLHDVSVQLGYVIGHAQPVSLKVISDGVDKKQLEHISDEILMNVDLSPQGIIDRFDLTKPIYHNVSSGGHFGKSDLPWEQLDLYQNW